MFLPLKLLLEFIYFSIKESKDACFSEHGVLFVVVCVLSVQFDGGDWERSTLPHTDQLRRTGTSRTSPPSSKTTSLRKHGDLLAILGERVDPVLPLEQQVYVTVGFLFFPPMAIECLL